MNFNTIFRVYLIVVMIGVSGCANNEVAKSKLCVGMSRTEVYHILAPVAPGIPIVSARWIVEQVELPSDGTILTLRYEFNEAGIPCLREWE